MSEILRVAAAIRAPNSGMLLISWNTYLAHYFVRQITGEAHYRILDSSYNQVATSP